MSALASGRRVPMTERAGPVARLFRRLSLTTIAQPLGSSQAPDNRIHNAPLFAEESLNIANSPSKARECKRVFLEIRL